MDERMANMLYLTVENALGATFILFLPAFYKNSPASASTKIWTTFYSLLLAFYVYCPEEFQSVIASVKHSFKETPVKATLTTIAILTPLKYIQTELRFARINAIKMKYRYTDDP